MAERFDIAVLIGSLRKESWNRKAFNALKDIAPASCSFRDVAIGDLAFYNEELESRGPAAGVAALSRRDTRRLGGVVRDAGI
jgi:chromate reductase